MRYLRVQFWALLLLLPSVSQAASFDCAKARSTLEVLICADLELSSLDAQVGIVYTQTHSQSALSQSEKGELLDKQRQFLKQRTEICPIPFTSELSESDVHKIITCLKEIYTLRLNELQKQPTPSNNHNAAEIIPAMEGSTWKVTSVEFPGISAIGEEEAKPYIGKTLEWYKGYLTSPFGNCEGCDLKTSYTKRTVEDLIAEDPKLYMGLKFPSSYALVHSFSWGENNNLELLQIDNQTLYIEREGAVFVLTKLSDAEAVEVSRKEAPAITTMPFSATPPAQANAENTPVATPSNRQETSIGIFILLILFALFKSRKRPDTQCISEPEATRNVTVLVAGNSSNASGIASFIMGLISIFFLSFLFAPLAILFGIIAVLNRQFVWGILGLLFAIIGFSTSPILMGLLGIAILTTGSH